jgi:hypothetical protein
MFRDKIKSKLNKFLSKIICYLIGHRWQYQGSRPCHYSMINCNIPIHFCLICGEYDLSDGLGFSGYNHCEQLIDDGLCCMVDLDNPPF